MGGQIQKDQDILQLLKKGDQKAFKKVFEVHYNIIYEFVQNLTKDRFQCEDITQETFIKFWNNREKIDIQTPIKGYLYKTAYNNFIDHYRKSQRNQMLKQEWYFQKIIEITEENVFIKERKIARLKKEIDLLPPKCKQIFVLSKLKNLKYQEIATKLNISIKTVENQMGIALSRLRKELRTAKNS